MLGSFIFSFMDYALGAMSKNSSLNPRPQTFPPMVSYKYLTALCFTLSHVQFLVNFL